MINQIAGTNYSTAMPAAQPTMSNHLQQIREEVMELVNRLGNVADRVIGGAPKAVGDSPKMAPNLHNVASDIKMALSNLRSEVDRLDNAL